MLSFENCIWMDKAFHTIFLIIFKAIAFWRWRILIKNYFRQGIEALALCRKTNICFQLPACTSALLSGFKCLLEYSKNLQIFSNFGLRHVTILKIKRKEVKVTFIVLPIAVCVKCRMHFFHWAHNKQKKNGHSSSSLLAEIQELSLVKWNFLISV